MFLSEKPFTILAPVNSSNTSPEAFLKNEALAEEIITNHFFIGEEIRPESLILAQEKTTAGGQSLKFSIDENGRYIQYYAIILNKAVS